MLGAFVTELWDELGAFVQDGGSLPWQKNVRHLEITGAIRPGVEVNVASQGCGHFCSNWLANHRKMLSQRLLESLTNR